MASTIYSNDHSELQATNQRISLTLRMIRNAKADFILCRELLLLLFFFKIIIIAVVALLLKQIACHQPIEERLI